MGRNGAGKSTTMKAIMGLIAERQGAVHFNGEDISRTQAVRDRAARPRLHAGGPAHLRRSHRDGKSRHRPPAAAPLRRRNRRRHHGRPRNCSRCSRISPRCRTGPGDRMSGGEQQMLTVARTLMGNPLLVLLDEPSEGVAPLIVEQMAQHHRRAEEGGSVDPALGTEHPFRTFGGGPRLRARKGADSVAGVDRRAR